MKNTLIIDMTNAYEVAHISSVNDGTDQFLLVVRCDSSKHVTLVNDLGTIKVNITSDEYVFEFPKPSWIGLGSSTFTLADDDGSQLFTINKTPACGGNYQLMMTDATTIRFQKQKDIRSDVYDATKETIIGTWIDGKPIYRKFLIVNRQRAYQSNVYISIGDIPFDTIINIKYIARNSSNGNFYTGNINSNSNVAYTNYAQTADTSGYNKSILLYTAFSTVAQYVTLWIEYTKSTDLPEIETEEEADTELRDEWTLAWEGNVGDDRYIDLPESMMRHKMLAFEMTAAADPTANGNFLALRIPTKQLKEFYKYDSSPNTGFMMSNYDTNYDRIFYISDTLLWFDFGTATKLRRVWFID